MTPAWMAVLIAACAGLIALLVWDQRRVEERRVRAQRNGRPLSAGEEHEWAVITARLIEEIQRD